MITPIPRIPTLPTNNRPFLVTITRVIGRNVPDQAAQIGRQETGRSRSGVAHEDIARPAVDVIVVVRGAFGPLARGGAVEGPRLAGQVGEPWVGGVGRVPGRVGGGGGGRGASHDGGHDGEIRGQEVGEDGERVGIGAEGCLAERRLRRR